MLKLNKYDIIDLTDITIIFTLAVYLAQIVNKAQFIIIFAICYIYQKVGYFLVTNIIKYKEK